MYQSHACYALGVCCLNGMVRAGVAPQHVEQHLAWSKAGNIGKNAHKIRLTHKPMLLYLWPSMFSWPLLLDKLRATLLAPCKTRSSTTHVHQCLHKPRAGIRCVTRLEGTPMHPHGKHPWPTCLLHAPQLARCVCTSNVAHEGCTGGLVEGAPQVHTAAKVAVGQSRPVSKGPAERMQVHAARQMGELLYGQISF